MAERLNNGKPFEVGRSYLRRDGEVVKLVRVRHDRGGAAYTCDRGTVYFASGYYDVEHDTPFDLMREHVGPPAHVEPEIWLSVYSASCGGAMPTPEEADRCAMVGRIGVARYVLKEYVPK